MESSETQRHSFIIRIWVEEVRSEGDALWRGHITHVFTKRRSYFESIDGITDFICPYLKDMGADCSASD